MKPNPRPVNLFRIALALLVGAALLTILSVQAVLAHPGETALQVTRRGGCGPITIITPTRRNRNVIPRLCGQLLFLSDYETGIPKIAILPCSGGQPYILMTHPRDIIPYYQFRNAVTAKSSQLLSEQVKAAAKQDDEEETDDPNKVRANEYVGTICTLEYGCIDRYITTFDNYVGIDSCDECGLYNLPPTWTHAPKFSYTPTSTKTPTPTGTPVTPSPTPTSTVVTPTRPVSELLFGTFEPTDTATATATRQPTAAGTPAGGPMIPTGPCTGGLGIVVFSCGLVVLALGLRLRQGL